MQQGMNDYDGDEAPQKGLASLQFRKRKASKIKPKAKGKPQVMMAPQSMPGMKRGS